MNTWPSEYPVNPIAEAVPATFCVIESCGDTHGTVDSTELFFRYFSLFDKYRPLNDSFNDTFNVVTFR